MTVTAIESQRSNSYRGATSPILLQYITTTTTNVVKCSYRIRALNVLFLALNLLEASVAWPQYYGKESNVDNCRFFTSIRLLMTRRIQTFDRYFWYYKQCSRSLRDPQFSKVSTHESSGPLTPCRRTRSIGHSKCSATRRNSPGAIVGKYPVWVQLQPYFCFEVTKSRLALWKGDGLEHIYIWVWPK